MKIAWPLAAFVLAGGVTLLRADPAENDNPAAYDPDATPRAYTEKPKPAPHQSAEQAEAQSTQAKEKNDWLVRAYEQQLQARSLADGQPQSNNLYNQITSDPELAKAAGLNPTTTSGTPATSGLRAGPSGGSPGLTLRNDVPSPGSAKAGAAKPAGSTFNPVLAPLDPSEAAALHSLFSSLPSFTDTTSLHLNSDATDSGALDVPGMTAAESDPAKRADLDLTLAHLPGEADAADRPQQSHQNLALAMPLRDSEQARTDQNAATVAPGQRKTAPPAPINPLLLKPVESDTAHMVPDPPPIRGQVADPYDILR